RGGCRQAFGAVLRCAENGQTFRCGDSDGRVSHIKELIAWRASKTLSCQRETLHSQQLRSIKKSIDSDHGIYRYNAASSSCGSVRIDRLDPWLGPRPAFNRNSVRDHRNPHLPREEGRPREAKRKWV